ncbi:MAG: hypothetical protein ACREVK_02360 [Gammaproteobacteria bacterium]
MRGWAPPGLSGEAPGRLDDTHRRVFGTQNRYRAQPRLVAHSPKPLAGLVKETTHRFSEEPKIAMLSR